MLFNSHIFIFFFLPVVLFGFYWIGKYSHNLAALWLVAGSLFFYGWWDARFVGLLLGSVVFNYGSAYLIGLKIPSKSALPSKMLLAGAIAVNLTLLGYYKYANFFCDNLNFIFGARLPTGAVFLPLGISFFTFTQIAFLVDTYQGKVKERNFIHYLLFVTYFPHLIAGPILHHKQMMPQFAKRGIYRINPRNFAAGMAIFVLGLAKKMLFADLFGNISDPVFNAAAVAGHPMLLEAWSGALAYTLQLYFDFSAYSDMAIGLSLMFNVRLPLNFNSPYKAASIIDFWRRWHMTLSQYLRDYLYIPLGGNRKGKSKRLINLMATMLLGGLWHGAGWTFVFWGGLHGLYLIVNHIWRNIKEKLNWGEGGRFANLGAGALTFMAVVTGWVFFRANSFSSAMSILRGMVGINGICQPGSLKDKLLASPMERGWIDGFLPTTLPDAWVVFLVLSIGLAVVWGLPNVHELFLPYRPTCNDFEKPGKFVGTGCLTENRLSIYLTWRPSIRQGLLYGFLFLILIVFMTTARKSEFLYFQF